MAILTVVIGIIFVLLLLSLLATTIMELIASLFHLRGRNLTTALHNMLASSDKSAVLLTEFKSNSLYRHLSQQYSKGTQGPPSYIDSATFQSILFDIILKGEGIDQLKDKIDTLPDEDLKNVLNQLLRDADNELDHFKEKIEKWYNDVMDRASGWYKRYIQKILLGVGIAIALVFNADTFAIYQRLESDPQTLQQVVALAEDFTQTQENTLVRAVDPSFEQSLESLQVLVNNQINTVKSPLGLGWSNMDFSGYGVYDWLAKALGYLVTALAISLGAPFWFDLLRKFVNIRSSGAKP
ncbi:MAG: hypothetical protein DA408_07405 [Bacteroidetes bacterium]|nr:MAG: hypothetical protein C7N36_18965 [Bacteroidota bacterium]PTM13335.1 MAG: hypothetical protein DA408_07405 [Bacteroidota bacterium]